MQYFIDGFQKIKVGMSIKNRYFLEKIIAYVKGDIDIEELFKNTDLKTKERIVYILNKIIEYKDLQHVYFIEKPQDKNFSTNLYWGIYKGNTEKIFYKNQTSKIQISGPTWAKENYKRVNIESPIFVPIIGNFSPDFNGVMLNPSDWYQIITKNPYFINEIINKELGKNINMQARTAKKELETEINNRLKEYLIQGQERDYNFNWGAKKEAKYLPKEIIDSIYFPLRKDLAIKDLEQQSISFKEMAENYTLNRHP